MTMVVTTIDGKQLRVWSDNTDEQTYTCVMGDIHVPIDVESDVFIDIPYHLVVKKGDHTDTPEPQLNSDIQCKTKYDPRFDKTLVSFRRIDVSK